MKFEDNYKVLHKSYTVIISVLGVLISLLEVVLPHLGLLQPMLDPVTYGFVMFGLTVSIAVGRYIKQDLPDGKWDGRVDENQQEGS